MKTIENYLVATDGSDNALRAAKHAAEMMKCNPNAKVTVLYVRPRAADMVVHHPFVNAQIADDEINQVAQSAVKKTVAVFEEALLKVNSVIITGEPGSDIAEYAKDNGFGIIIMGTRGLSNLRGIIMGSVSHQILHFSDVPVLFVK